MNPTVLVTIVTYNSASHLRPCLESLKLQDYPNFRVCLWDNASTDLTLEVVARYRDFLDSARFSPVNLGFSAGHNRLIGSTPSDYVLVLNPDVVLSYDFIRLLKEALDLRPEAGSATGKLWRLDTGAPEHSILDPREPFRRVGARMLDSTGIYFTPNQRHLDRGSGEPDRGQYNRAEWVFGATGAAAFYRRTMLEDIRTGTEYFDEAFFSYREDADLAWRAQWMGWSCLYLPQAQGFHVRRVLPERRSSLPADINMHSFKNRFLMRIKNMDAGTYLRFFLPITLRDLLALAYVLVRERSSLRAFVLIGRAFGKSWEVRAALRRHRRVPPRRIRAWFAWRPAAFAAPPVDPVLKRSADSDHSMGTISD